MLTRKLLACAAVSALAGSQAHAGEAAAPPPDNAAVYNADGSVSIAIPPFSVPNSVRNRTRPEYDAPGIRIGSFVLRPSLNTGAAFNSNVFSTEDNQKSDWNWEFAPVLRLVSDFSRHALDFLLQTRSLIYKQHSSENITDVTASVNGRIDVLRSTTISSGSSYRILHEARGAPDMPANAAKPTRFSISRAEASLYHVLNRLRISAGGSIERYVFADTRLQGPSPQTLTNRDRDRDVYSSFAQAGYEFSPGYSVFLRGSYNDRHYDLQLDRSGVDRNSHGYTAEGGVQFELTRLVVGQIYGGYLAQRFNDTAFSNIDGATFGAQLEWNPTQLTTLRLDIRRTIEETTLIGASSFTNSRFNLGVDHELLRNVIVSLDGFYENDKYNGAVRTDNIFGVSIGVAYLVNRNFEFNVGYAFTKRQSNQGGLGYSNQALRFAIVGKF